MPDLAKPGDAIEGMKVQGSSRKPLVHRGMQDYDGRRCHRFVGQFNVRARIVEALPAGWTPVLEPAANLSLDAELICDKAIVHSFDDSPKGSVSAGSATHQTNFWLFKKQTAACIERAHQELVNAMARSEERGQLKGG